MQTSGIYNSFWSPNINRNIAIDIIGATGSTGFLELTYSASKRFHYYWETACRHLSKKNDTQSNCFQVVGDDVEKPMAIRLSE